MEISLISNSHKFYEWEVDWVSSLLGDFEIKHILDPACTALANNPILVLSGQLVGAERQICDYIRRLRSHSRSVGLIHLSDEWHTAPVSFYPDASFVFRNYYRANALRGAGRHYFPLGYRAGFTKKLVVKDLRDRAAVWAFAGAVKGTRMAMLNQARQIPGGKYHLTGGAYDAARGAQPLTVDEYAGLLGDAVFALCPRGNRSMDCFRLYEALEAGAIPIVEDSGGGNEWLDILSPSSFVRIHGWRPDVLARSLKHVIHGGYWRKAYGSFPCPTINHWQNLGVVMKRIDVERTSECVRSWWLAYKRQLRESLRSAITSNFHA
jgi:hypothetical protein